MLGDSVGFLVLGMLLGAAAIFILRVRGESKLRLELAEAKTTLELERRHYQQNREFQELSQQTLRESFQALSGEALERSKQSLIEIAKLQLEKVHESQKGELELRQQSIKELLQPVKEQLLKVDSKLEQVEKTRIGEGVKLQEQISHLVASESRLREETTKLVHALRTPNVRGRWGEIQLRRCVEIAGMVSYCDFYEQQSVMSENDRLRPDMLIRLPNERQVVIDSKVPMQSFLDALGIADAAQRQSKLEEHAALVKRHVDQLGEKKYWDSFERSPEFVVLFLPSESFFSSALETNPNLIEYAANKKVILATPTTLISLLQAVSLGWREEQLAQNAREVQRIGKDFYDKAQILAKHFLGVRKGLEATVRSYNEAVASFEGRFLVAARRFKELGVPGTKEIEEVLPIETLPRAVNLIGPEQ